MVSPRLANQVAEGSAQLLGTGPIIYDLPVAGPNKFDGFRSSDACASRITSRAKSGFYSGMEMLRCHT
jgi:hypothetical protein